MLNHSVDDAWAAIATLGPAAEPSTGGPVMTILDRFRLDDRVAVVTGASSGLGVTFATALADAGADLVLAARREDRLADTRNLVEETGRRAIAVRTDVTSPEDCRALVDAAMRAFGRVDVLVNNAGVGTAVPAVRETPDQFRSVVDVNLNGCYWMAQACGRIMQPGSSIINISSVLGLTTAGLPQAAYARDQGRPDRPHPRPGPAVDRTQRHPSQCAGTRLFRVRDD
jgi:nucleoside-diphosphate-sugar epimerase